MSIEPAPTATKRTHVRYLIVLILFLLTAINYADRATLSIVGTDLSDELQLDTVWMGYVFSAFAWAYVIGQIPGGWLLDRMGSRRVYGWSIGLWSLFTLLQGFIGRRGPVVPRQCAHRG
jgi:ACS family glucarate transporter-like MFS transporter